MTPTLEEQILVTLIRLQQDMADISKRLESLEYTVKVQREEQAKRLPVSKVIWFNFYHYLRKRSKCIYHVTFISLHQDMADISKRLESLEYTVKVQREEQAKRLPVSKVIWFDFL